MSNCINIFQAGMCETEKQRRFINLVLKMWGIAEEIATINKTVSFTLKELKEKQASVQPLLCLLQQSTLSPSTSAVEG